MCDHLSLSPSRFTFSNLVRSFVLLFPFCSNDSPLPPPLCPGVMHSPPLPPLPPPPPCSGNNRASYHHQLQHHDYAALSAKASQPQQQATTHTNHLQNNIQIAATLQRMQHQQRSAIAPNPIYVIDTNNHHHHNHNHHYSQPNFNSAPDSAKKLEATEV